MADDKINKECEIKKLQKLIDEKNEGDLFTLKELCESNWESIDNPIELGRSFKNAVDEDQLNNIQFVKKKSDNSSLYRKKIS